MKRLTDEELAELEDIERRTTAGPWRRRDIGDETIESESTGALLCTFPFTHENDRGNAVFVATARNALPSLLAEVRELRAFKARFDAVVNCDRCRFGIEWGELGDADACSKCGGLEGVVSP